MSEPTPIAEFRSDRFAPILPDESQVNPGVFGAELAYWLSAELARRGVVTSYPEYEDWGWFIEYSAESGAEFALWCTNIDGSTDHWSLVLRAHRRGLFRRDQAPISEAAPLLEAVRDVLEAETSVSGLAWRSSEHAA